MAGTKLGARFARADARLFRHLIRHRSAVADRALRDVSRAANRSLLWCALAGAMALVGGRCGRHAAARGLLAIGIASALVNGPLKLSWRRQRPRVSPRLPRRGLIATPGSSSFPSGHAASAFAFATASAAECGAGALPIGALAVTVAYSRIYTGVHYPGDVLAGAAVGIVAGVCAGPLARAVRPSRHAQPADSDEVGVPRQAVVLFSPHAGSAHRLDPARRAMIGAGVEILEEIPIEHHDGLAPWIARAGETPLLIVAAGGDGTVGTAADYAANSDAVLGVLPLGTSNDFARSLGIPPNPVKAARLFREGKVSTIDVGRMVVPGRPSRHFVHAATAGLNVSFAKLATKASLRRRFGRLTYAVAAAQALREHEVFGCELHHDAGVESLELVHLSVINAPVFGGFLGMRIAGASLTDRSLDVIAVEHLPLRRLILAALHPLLGIRRPIRGIRTWRVPWMRAHTARELDVALDGEILGTIPADFEVAGEALRVVTHADFEDHDH